MIALLRRRPAYRRLFAAHAVSRAGDAFNTVALVVLVFRLTGSGTGVAGSVVFEALPVLLFAPIAGLLVDRLPRRRVMVAADLARAGLAAWLAVSHGSVVTAYAAAFGLSTGALLFNPAAASLLPDTIDDDNLVDANAGMWTVAVLAQIILAPLAGVAIATVGVGAAFAANAASYLVSAALLRGLPGDRRPEHHPDPIGWRAAALGLHTVRAHPLLARLAVAQVLAALSAGATSALLVVLAGDWLGVGPSGFGLLLAAIGAGAAVAPALIRRYVRPAQPLSLFGPYAVRGVVDLALAAFAHPLVAGVVLFTYGTATSTGMIAYNTTLQAEVDSTVRGRTYALFDVLWSSARLVSLAAGGILADTLGIRAVYLVAGVLLLVAAAYGLVPPHRRKDSPAVQSPNARRLRSGPPRRPYYLFRVLGGDVSTKLHGDPGSGLLP